MSVAAFFFYIWAFDISVILIVYLWGTMGYTQDLLLGKHSIIGLLMPTYNKEINILKYL